jgi:hypothetical protein
MRDGPLGGHPQQPHLHLQGSGIQGAGKKKVVGDPHGGWVGQSTKKDWGQIYFFDIFLIVFLSFPHRETPKNVIKKQSRKSRFWIFGRIFCKNFSTRFFL